MFILEKWLKVNLMHWHNICYMIFTTNVSSYCVPRTHCSRQQRRKGEEGTVSIHGVYILVEETDKWPKHQINTVKRNGWERETPRACVSVGAAWAQEKGRKQLGVFTGTPFMLKGERGFRATQSWVPALVLSLSGWVTDDLTPLESVSLSPFYRWSTAVFEN